MNWKASLFLIAILLCTAGFFEFSPAVEKARAYVSLENYQTKAPCSKILQNRPWYGKINHWFWLWIILIPIFIFSKPLQTSSSILIIKILIAVPLCYYLMFKGFDFSDEAQHKLFTENSYFPDPLNGWRMDCYSSSTGARAFFPILGSFKALVYVGFCESIWLLYYKKVLKGSSSIYLKFLNAVLVTISTLGILAIMGIIIMGMVIYF